MTPSPTSTSARIREALADGRFVDDADAVALLQERDELREALQMLYSETADYIRLNNLGGMDNQCMKLARAALTNTKD